MLRPRTPGQVRSRYSTDNNLYASITVRRRGGIIFLMSRILHQWRSQGGHRSMSPRRSWKLACLRLLGVRPRPPPALVDPGMGGPGGRPPNIGVFFNLKF